jgi:aminopeptidase N
VIEPYLRLAGDAAEFWAGDAERPALMAKVFSTCSRLAAADPGRRQVALRGMIRCAADLDAVASLEENAEGDADLLWRCLVRKAELGGETAAAVDELLARDPDPDAAQRALAVRAARPDAAAKAEIWQAVAVDRAVPIGAMREVMTAFYRPGQDAILAGYGEKYLALLPTFDRGGMVPSMVYSGRLLPRFATGPDFPSVAEKAVADAAPVIRQTVLEYADLLRRMLRTRST